MGPIYDTMKILHMSYKRPYLDMLRDVCMSKEAIIQESNKLQLTIRHNKIFNNNTQFTTAP